MKDRKLVDSGSTASRWIILECPQPRSHAEVEFIWRRLTYLKHNLRRGAKTDLQRYIKMTGIKRKPIMARLSLDFVQSVPYGPMHLLLLGWVKHIILLSSGIHPKAKLSPLNYGSTHISHVNKSLRDGGNGITPSWGRPTLSIEHLEYFKAEDFKAFGQYYGQILFSASCFSKEMQELWIKTARVLEIVLDPTPLRRDVTALRNFVERLHEMFCDLFYQEDEQSFCFTPTTHAILHLPDMMEECGPLLNVSQFVVERFVGETGPLVKSRTKAETDMFNTHMKLFSLRLLKSLGTDGEQPEERSDCEDGSDSGTFTDFESSLCNTGNCEYKDNGRMRGKGKVVGGKERLRECLSYV